MQTLFSTANIDLKSGPDWTLEKAAIREIGACERTGMVAGVDEVGRGPLAGPVVAAAVILNPNAMPDGLDDSKKLTAKKRAVLYDHIIHKAVAWSVAEVSVQEIDQLNILQAALKAMRLSVNDLSVAPDAILVDGNMDPQFNPAVPTRTVVKGDARSLSIAAASIIAKVYRDRLMQKLDRDYPGYGWDTNAGYGSKAHRNAIIALGITPHHRRSFSPVKDMVGDKNRP